MADVQQKPPSRRRGRLGLGDQFEVGEWVVEVIGITTPVRAEVDIFQNVGSSVSCHVDFAVIARTEEG